MAMRRPRETLPDLVAVHTEGRVVYVNPAGVKLLGATSRESPIGKPVLDLIHPDFHAQAKNRIRQVLEQKMQTPLAEVSIIRLDGQESQVEVSGTFLESLDRPSILLIVRDISERKSAEKEINRLNRDLWARVNELQTIFEVVPIGLAIAEDFQGLHIRGNPTNETQDWLFRAGTNSLGSELHFWGLHNLSWISPINRGIRKD